MPEFKKNVGFAAAEMVKRQEKKLFRAGKIVHWLDENKIKTMLHDAYNIGEKGRLPNGWKPYNLDRRVKEGKPFPRKGSVEQRTAKVSDSARSVISKLFRAAKESTAYRPLLQPFEDPNAYVFPRLRKAHREILIQLVEDAYILGNDSYERSKSAVLKK